MSPAVRLCLRARGVNGWECQMRRADDELREISVLLLESPNYLGNTVGVKHSNAIIIFFSRGLMILCIFIYFYVQTHAHRYIFSF